jgi:hypothetical protein
MRASDPDQVSANVNLANSSGETPLIRAVQMP